MVEVAEELVEAMDGWQKSVLVTEMVLAELTSRIAHRLNTVAMVGASSGIPSGAPACPTVVSPVRIGSSPVMKFARPAVQLASA